MRCAPRASNGPKKRSRWVGSRYRVYQYILGGGRTVVRPHLGSTRGDFCLTKTGAFGLFRPRMQLVLMGRIGQLRKDGEFSCGARRGHFALVRWVAKPANMLRSCRSPSEAVRNGAYITGAAAADKVQEMQHTVHWFHGTMEPWIEPCCSSIVATG